MVLTWETMSSEEARVRVLYYAPLAELFDRPVAVHRDRTVLDVQLLKPPTVVGDELYPLVGDHLATLGREFLQVGTVFRESLEAHVRDVTLADVQRPQPRARPGQGVEGVVTDGLAASDIEVPELVAQPGQLLDAGIGDRGALGHREVPEVGSQLGQLVHPQVGHVTAI